jgi:hypothetical protein
MWCSALGGAGWLRHRRVVAELLLAFPPTHMVRLGAFLHQVKALPGILPVLTTSDTFGVDFFAGGIVGTLLDHPLDKNPILILGWMLRRRVSS